MNTVLVENKKISPSKVLCVGRNYSEHIAELNNSIPDQMVVFNKPNSSISTTLTSYHQEPLHYEGEICFVIHNSQITHVGFGLDLTKRALQSELKSKQLPWERAKAFNGSAVFSRFIPISYADIPNLTLELFINCVRVQSGGVKDMMFKPLEIVDELLGYTQLEDGDVIMTGTPKGVGTVEKGDVFLARIKCNDKTLIEAEWEAK
ncbi:putative 2-keto-4-pentenoate hydratase/2-oxohepta-3-ene-1,7-dioic acid hydratase/FUMARYLACETOACETATE HYDROLASE [Vibrio nigripulchritudo SFn27]|uniref:Putative 2-keto-4-pentenoate hydratase/2-oxohepta-3-ene-1,7-dioic acid hydratase/FUMARYLACETOACETATE HYDROLASE n=1 Tax=Vibrio nigripulchritudo TaxID=28173 RepID=U4K7M7_9VIBR|nr:fumarylacetoacetate hydrolase family protein [Vibrio nigripulchritudo]CCN82230.1 putative 2-keto-4-pentenoate hydratase/2-oxohepta-3-ene-1,7-dioic acid hydratase/FUMARYLACETOACETATE HYDROLASE [Vibrio nigripulchritudo BLFn1]CCN91327.1 putative 2-keto-4-pentenoate hydratase/2-oxohepta-3-ene-1,7-dioic acid hydratase/FUMARYLACETOACETATE HYDROLASE [Vibrio nigripulchritudo SFn27]CCN93697.1 putative 2-keto-4-pentenoate hydratase/2-oxohepta-3-ene-1,7-dioic acid hydratase/FUMARYLACETOACETATE HYDROLASE